MNQHVEIKLLELMAKNNIRQIKDLHERTGISRTVISELLLGKKKAIAFETILRLCKEFDCEIGELIVVDNKAAS